MFGLTCERALPPAAFVVRRGETSGRGLKKAQWPISSAPNPAFHLSDDPRPVIQGEIVAGAWMHGDRQWLQARKRQVLAFGEKVNARFI